MVAFCWWWNRRLGCTWWGRVEFYKRIAKKPLFIHHQSAIREKSKINFIRNERKHIQDKCSTETTATKHQNMFDDVLCLNGYPESIIDFNTSRTTGKTLDPSTQNSHTWRSHIFPNVSTKRINYIFWITIQVAHKSYTLRQALSQNNTQQT